MAMACQSIEMKIANENNQVAHQGGMATAMCINKAGGINESENIADEAGGVS